MSDTADRSLAHWSEEGRAGMDAFYRVARQDYRLLAQARDWPSLLAGRRTLLDVACGSGKFPEALDRYAELPPRPEIEYALLDPSPFSIAEARRALAPPFVAGAELQCPLQELDPAAGPFDVVWAIHALYALPGPELDLGLERFVGALAPDGLGAIANAAHDAHYLRFYRDHLADFRGGEGTPYTSSEQIVSALRRLGAPVAVQRLDYLGRDPPRRPGDHGGLPAALRVRRHRLARRDGAVRAGGRLPGGVHRRAGRGAAAAAARGPHPDRRGSHLESPEPPEGWQSG